MLPFENVFKCCAFHRMLHFARNRRENFKSKLIAIEDLSRINWMSALLVLWEIECTVQATYLNTPVFSVTVTQIEILGLGSGFGEWAQAFAYDICVVRCSLSIHVEVVGNGLLFKSIWSIWVFVSVCVCARCVTKWYLKHYQQTC